MRLTIELVPRTCWYTNVRSNVSKDEWNVIRKKCYAKAGYKCEICKDVGQNQGTKHPVECHEIWDYNDTEHIQKLVGLIALCTNCHKTKHVGLAQLNGEEEIVINQLMKVNSISRQQAEKYIEQSFEIWKSRSQFEWKLDISYIEKYLS